VLDELCAALPSLPASDEADGLRRGEHSQLHLRPLHMLAPGLMKEDVVSSVVEESVGST